MRVDQCAIEEVLILTPEVFRDERGFFLESFNLRNFHNETGLVADFVQDNHSRSSRGVLRGLHYQLCKPQGKLVQVIRGRIFDVVVDLRRSSASFGQWVGVLLDEEKRQQIWVPAGFAHGFLALSEVADVLYKTTDYYAPEHERCLRWDDPSVAVSWPLEVLPLLSPKDANGCGLEDCEVFA